LAVSRDEQERRGRPTRLIYCRLCRVKLNADGQAEQHFAGKLHARKTKMMMMLNRETMSAVPRSLTQADTQVTYMYLLVVTVLTVLSSSISRLPETARSTLLV